jgi:hypothetical protein
VRKFRKRAVWHAKGKKTSEREISIRGLYGVQNVEKTKECEKYL